MNARYTIKPAKSLVTDKSKEAGHKILETDIDFTLDAIEDSDIYRFVYNLNYGFPGQIAINRFSISRDVAITQPLLRKIGTGGAEALVTGKLNVTWRTMVLDETLKASSEGEENDEGY